MYHIVMYSLGNERGIEVRLARNKPEEAFPLALENIVLDAGFCSFNILIHNSIVPLDTDMFLWKQSFVIKHI